MPAPPSRLGHYLLGQRLGSGHLGTVYRATRAAPDGVAYEVAIKVCSAAATSGLRRRLANEAEVLRRLRHPHIAGFLEYGEEGGFVFLVTDLVEGPTLEQLVAHAQPLAQAEVLEIGMQLADALDCAHTHADTLGNPTPVIHRDLKPSNAVLGLDGRARLIDFGIAKAGFRPWDLTIPGQLQGTPRYMAPEQVGAAPAGESAGVDERTDLYCLGLVLFTLARGTPMFDAPDLVGTLRQVRAGAIESALMELLSGPHAALAPILKRALQRDPARRFPSAYDMREALRDAARGLRCDRRALRERARVAWSSDRVAQLDETLAPLPTLQSVEISIISDA